MSDNLNSKRHKTMANNNNNNSTHDNNNPSLPEEIIYQILTRLPVKSLLQFRSVSKLWLALISSPQFIHTHLGQSIRDTSLKHHNIMLSSTHPYNHLTICSVYSVFDDISCDVIQPDYPMKDPHNHVWVVGCVNGLVCLAVEEYTLFLWNPATRKSRRLRSPDVVLDYGCYLIYGFGYDQVADDYKVVGMFCFFRSGGEYDTTVKVYSSKEDIWRKIGDFPFGIPFDDSGKFASGSLHWAASGDMRSGSPDSWLIVAFNLATENYVEIAQPNFGNSEHDLTLGVLGESLCILCNYGRTIMDVWVMKEYCVRESWTKLVTIPYLNDPIRDRYSVPLAISENGVIVMEFEGRLVLYNANEKTLKDLEFCKRDLCLEAQTYVESLISPNF